VVFLTNNDYYDPVNNTQKYNNGSLNELTTTTFEKIVSGTPFSFIVLIKDNDGELYYTDTGSLATLKNLGE